MTVHSPGTINIWLDGNILIRICISCIGADATTTFRAMEKNKPRSHVYETSRIIRYKTSNAIVKRLNDDATIRIGIQCVPRIMFLKLSLWRFWFCPYKYIYIWPSLTLRHFPHYWPVVFGFPSHPVRNVELFSLLLVQMSCWANSRTAGDFRHLSTHAFSDFVFVQGRWSKVEGYE